MPFQFPSSNHGSLLPPPLPPPNAAMAFQGAQFPTDPRYYVPQQHQQKYEQQQHPSKVVETKYFVTRNGPLGTPGQASAAASFFARAHQKLGQPQQQPQQHIRLDSEERTQFPTNFRTLVHRSPPQIPSSLLRQLDSPSDQQGMGKIRVVGRVTKPQTAGFPTDENPQRHFQLDRRRRQVTLYDPAAFRGPQGDIAPEERKIGVAAPKMFAFDGLFSSEDSHEDVCAIALPDVIQSVLNGSDGCVFCFGHANLGKTRSMLGSDQCAKDMGTIPIAIAWLYRAIKERKTKQGARFSVRVSAMEITSQREEVRDLLAPYETENDQSPAVYLNHLPVAGRCLQNQSELRAPSAERAAHYLDAALAGRSLDSQGRESHLIYTLHVYQYSVQPGSKSSGRSRMHLIDFGGCERTKTPGGGITLSGLGNVLLGIFNGQKHLPHRDSKVTQVLRECLGSLTCQATMLAHISPEACHYSETLHTVQLASRLHRMRRKRMKASSSHSSGGSTSSDEHRRLSKFKSHHAGMGINGRRSGSDRTTSGTSTAYSSSEMSCDTVVYRGQSDGSGTDSEHPPSIYLPASLRSLNGLHGQAANSAPGSLRGSYDDIPRPSSAHRQRKKILTNGAISPRRNMSPQPMAVINHPPLVAIQQQRMMMHGSPNRSLSSLPVIHEVNTNSRKMPLNGLVPVQGRRKQEERAQSPLARNYNNNNGFASKEIWIDAPPTSNINNNISNNNNNPPLPQVLPSSVQQQQQVKAGPQRRTYGYMDEHKQSMISSWVENQSCEDVNSSFQALTQFKVASDDVESEQRHQVIVHSEPVAVKRLPPPPPPRRTPPRDMSSSSQIRTGGGEGITDLVEECNIMVENLNNNNNNNHQLEEENRFEHPLRILSEENLTVVSSFGGSLKDLSTNDHEEVDPSKLSFFEVPDFASMKDTMEEQEDIISRRFREFAQLEKTLSPLMLKKKREEEEMKKKREEEQFKDPRYQEKEVLLTFSRSSSNNINNNVNNAVVQPLPRLSSTPSSSPRLTPKFQPVYQPHLTPQKQFALLAQSLRHPDGSSNPELNVAERSPGNGRSSSDLDEDLDNGNNSKESSPALIAPAPSPPVAQQKKESSGGRFASRFLKIFGSTRKLNNKSKQEESNNGRRSKSCDGRANNNITQQPAQQNNNKGGLGGSRLFRGSIRSANSSPSIKVDKKMKQQPTFPNMDPSMDHNNTLGTPSVLSLATTEWEFQKEDADPQEEEVDDEVLEIPFLHMMHPPMPRPDRKSSGYDSLGGDESSSLDSNEEQQRQQLQRRMQQLESGNGMQELPYSEPSDSKGVQLIQYDEVDIIRMEHRLKQIYS